MGHVPYLRARRTAALVLGLWLALWHAHSWLGSGLDLGPLTDRGGYVAVLFGSAALCAWRAMVASRTRTAWALIAAGIAAWALGDTYFTAVMWNDPSPPVPSPADAGYLLLPPLVLAGIVGLLRAHARDLPPAQWVDGVAVGLSVGALSAAVAFDTVIDRLTGSPLEIATNIAYPAADIVLLAVIAGALAGMAWRADATLWLLAAGIAAFGVADSIYVVHVAEGTYEAGGWLDAGWSVGIWLMGAAACQGPMRSVPSARGEALRRIAVPLGFGGASLALLAFGSLVGLNPVAVALATACILVVMGRLLVTFRDHVAMLTDSRREALSDPLTSLGNRRALQADLTRAMAASLEGQHHALILLELEGVKEFNDTLGRTAGDALLVRLASRLATLAGTARPAYRTRGGEFAIVAPLQPGEDSDELALKLADSLAECIDGIEVRCHGAGLTMGDEAGTIPAAMRLADQRLHERRTALQTA